jgi:hypothetical protein
MQPVSICSHLQHFDASAIWGMPYRASSPKDFEGLAFALAPFFERCSAGVRETGYFPA